LHVVGGSPRRCRPGKPDLPIRGGCGQTHRRRRNGSARRASAARSLADPTTREQACRN
jgi:hypothetical protein